MDFGFSFKLLQFIYTYIHYSGFEIPAIKNKTKKKPPIKEYIFYLSDGLLKFTIL